MRLFFVKIKVSMFKILIKVFKSKVRARWTQFELMILNLVSALAITTRERFSALKHASDVTFCI